MPRPVLPVLWALVEAVWLWSLLPGEPGPQERCRDELSEPELPVQDAEVEGRLEPGAARLEPTVRAMLQLQEPGWPQQVHLVARLANGSWPSA